MFSCRFLWSIDVYSFIMNSKWYMYNNPHKRGFHSEGMNPLQIYWLLSIKILFIGIEKFWNFMILMNSMFLALHINTLVVDYMTFLLIFFLGECEWSPDFVRFAMSRPVTFGNIIIIISKYMFLHLIYKLKRKILK